MKTLDAATLETLITNAMQTDDWATVHDLEPRLDAATAPKTLPKMLSAALWYSEQGLHVFPLQPRLKIPHSASNGATKPPQTAAPSSPGGHANRTPTSL